MKRVFIFSVSCLIFLAVAQSCKVDTLDQLSDGNDEQKENVIGSIEDSSPTTKSAFSDLFAGKDTQGSKEWSTAAFTLGNNLFSSQSCRLDDVMTISKSGMFTYNGGAVLCNAEDNETTRTGTWSYNQTNKTVTFRYGDVSYDGVIEAINDKALIIKGKYRGITVLTGRYKSE